MRNLTELLSLLYGNFALVSESSELRQLLSELRHFYVELQCVFAVSAVEAVFMEVLLVCAECASLD